MIFLISIPLKRLQQVDLFKCAIKSCITCLGAYVGQDSFMWLQTYSNSLAILYATEHSTREYVTLCVPEEPLLTKIKNIAAAAGPFDCTMHQRMVPLA